MPGDDYKMRTQAQTIHITNPSLCPYSIRLKYSNDFLLFFIKFMLTYSLLWRILAARGDAV